MSCDPAGLAALSQLVQLKQLTIRNLGYREKHSEGHTLYVHDTKRLTKRLWEMIAARKKGTPLPDRWLALDDKAVQAARNRQADHDEAQAARLRKQAQVLLDKAAALLEKARALRAGAK